MKIQHLCASEPAGRILFAHRHRLEVVSQLSHHLDHERGIAVPHVVPDRAQLLIRVADRMPPETRSHEAAGECGGKHVQTHGDVEPVEHVGPTSVQRAPHHVLEAAEAIGDDVNLGFVPYPIARQWLLSSSRVGGSSLTKPKSLLCPLSDSHRPIVISKPPAALTGSPSGIRPVKGDREVLDGTRAVRHHGDRRVRPQTFADLEGVVTDGSGVVMPWSGKKTHRRRAISR
jgi:hypothetical protein